MRRRSCRSAPATSSPPSVVTSVRFSGTRQTSAGCTSSAIAIISAVAAISRFMRVCRAVRIARTSRSWMWRRSSRRCSVMLSAPHCSATSAACSGSGERPPRACRTVATWSMFTPSRMASAGHPPRPRRRMASITSRLASPRPSRQCAIAAPKMPRAARCASGAVEFAARDREHGPPGMAVRCRIPVPHREHAAAGLEMIVPIVLERPVAARFPPEVEAIAEFLEQHALERAQRRLLGRPGQRRERLAIGVIERLVAVFLRQQLEQQFVEVERRNQPSRRERRRAAGRLGGRQRAAVRAARPRHEERNERAQHRAVLRLRAPRAVREQRHAAVVRASSGRRSGWCRSRGGGAAARPARAACAGPRS